MTKYVFLFCVYVLKFNKKYLNKKNSCLTIHLIPKWRLSQMIWVELHENEASRAKRRCLQMLLKVAIRCHASELLCSRV